MTNFARLNVESFALSIHLISVGFLGNITSGLQACFDVLGVAGARWKASTQHVVSGDVTCFGYHPRFIGYIRNAFPRVFNAHTCAMSYNVLI